MGRATVGLFLALLLGGDALAADAEVRRRVRLYTGPGTFASRVRTLDVGERLDAQRREGNYVFVVTGHEEQGWVYGPYIQLLEPIVEDDGDPLVAGAAIDRGAMLRGKLGELSPDELRVHYIDVGQGDATLLEFPCGAALVDAGAEVVKEDGEVVFDGVARLEAYLEDFFERREDLDGMLDLLVVTHPHPDHSAGLRRITDRWTVGAVLDNGLPGGKRSGRPQRDLQDLAERDDDMDYTGVDIGMVPAGEGLTTARIDPIGACEASDVDPVLTVLWGALDPAHPDGEHMNDHSVTLRVDHGEASFLFTGDLEEHSIDDMLARHAASPELLDVDVYQAGHHGSHNGTTSELVAAMSPDLAVFSMGPFERQAGRWNAYRYGHPHRDAVLPLEGAVRCQRTPAVRALGVKGAWRDRPPQFEEASIDGALFATGWDGTVVVRAWPDGELAVVTEKALDATGFDCGP